MESTSSSISLSDAAKIAKLLSSMHKLSVQEGNDWVEHSHPAVFCRQSIEGNVVRLAVGVPAGDSEVLRRLLACMKPPLYLLYVLHTPRGEGDPGRYQSPALGEHEVLSFLAEFAGLLGSDARHDVWVHSPEGSATLVWERHNVIYAYGPIGSFESALIQLGFGTGKIGVDFPHQHHYRAEYDEAARAVLTRFNWSYSALRPEDEQ